MSADGWEDFCGRWSHVAYQGKGNHTSDAWVTEKGSIITCESTAPREGESHPISLLGRNVTPALLVLREVSKALVPCGDSSRRAHGLASRSLCRNRWWVSNLRAHPVFGLCSDFLHLKPHATDQKQPGASGAIPVPSKSQDFASSC